MIGLRRRYEADSSRVMAQLEPHLRTAWRSACEGVGLGRRIDTVCGGSTITPRVESITERGDVVVLLVRLVPGQLPEDVEAVGYRLAPALGAAQLRVTPVSDMTVRVELLAADPLAGHVAFPAAGPLLLGRDEHARDITGSWSTMPHLIVQGATRSGKSWLSYSVLAQSARDRSLVIAGCDPTGLLLRPFAGSRHDPWQARTLREVEAHPKLLARLVDEMDRRISAMPADRDTCVVDLEQPLILVVLEEYPALLAATDAQDVKLGKQLRALVSRLAAESHKAGMRLIIIAQRAEATIVSGLVRAQCEGKISFRVDNLDSIKLLHPDASPDHVTRHVTAGSGIALISMPGHPLRRMRAPAIGGYAEYVDAVATACLPDHQ